MAYEAAREPHCCDPCDLAYGLGLRPCPTRTEVAFIRDGVLHYPEDASLPQLGLAIYRLLAKMLWPRYERLLFERHATTPRLGDHFRLMVELILPEQAAKTSAFCDLARLQPNAPLGLVQAIYMSHGRSGIIRAPRLS
jgi:hypothetical protein